MSDTPLIKQIRRGMSQYQAQTIVGEYPEAAVVVAISNGAKPGVLLTQRSPHLSLHAGEIAFPGGKQDEDDHSLLHTAVREMEEEVGVPALQFESFGTLHQRITRTQIRVTPYLGILPADIPLTINLGELDSAFYVPVEQLCSGELFSVVNVLDKGVRRRVARFQFGDYDIWGVTAMILADAMNSLLGAKLPIDTQL
ncbi:MAG: 8-oxo-dGTP pyrophosphatase MutT (NUDIX family) [Bermanella sp.]|jgi:8-oxo-dGTP pyrophosphatase MutT (NUDIX family)